MKAIIALLGFAFLPLSALGQGPKATPFTTNTAPVITNIIRNLVPVNVGTSTNSGGVTVNELAPKASPTFTGVVTTTNLYFTNGVYTETYDFEYPDVPARAIFVDRANTSLGAYALRSNVTSYASVAIGTRSLESLTSTNADGQTIGNVAIGNVALQNFREGRENTALGNTAGSHLIYGFENLFLGAAAADGLTNGTHNIIIGVDAGKNFYNGNENIFLGTSSGQASSGSSNVLIGNFSGQYESGSNVFYLDNLRRDNQDDGRTNALLFGRFAESPENQLLVIHAKTVIGITAPNTEVNQSTALLDLRLEDGNPGLALSGAGSYGGAVQGISTRGSFSNPSNSAAGDQPLQFYSKARSSTDLWTGASMFSIVEGAVVDGQMPGQAWLLSTAPTNGLLTPRVWIGSNGKVGVGTTNPVDILHLSAITPKLVLKSTILDDYGSGIIFADTDSNEAAIDVDNLLHTFNISLQSTNRFTIKSDGKAGFGTTLPESKLHLQSTTGNSDFLLDSDNSYGGAISSRSSRGTVASRANSGSGDTPLQIYSSAYSGSFLSGASIVSYVDGSVTTAQMPPQGWKIATAPANGTLTDRLVISSIGNVGIGTTNPAALLEVTGSTAGNYVARISNTSASGYGLLIDLPANATAGELALTVSNPDGAILVATSDGKVGIGTASPAAKLDVAGDIRASTTINATNGFGIGANTVNSWDDVTNYFSLAVGSGGATNGIQQLDGFGTNTQFYSTAYNAGTEVYDTETGFFYSADDHSLRIDLEEGELFLGGSVRLHWGNRALNGDWSADSNFTVAGTFAASGSATVADTVYADAGYFTNDCSALTFTDRSKAPASLKDAWEIVSSMKTKDGHVDHGALSPKAWGTRTRTVTNTAPRFVNGLRRMESKLGTTTEPDQTKRDLGMVVSAQALVIQDLLKRLEKLEKK